MAPPTPLASPKCAEAASLTTSANRRLSRTSKTRGQLQKGQRQVQSHLTRGAASQKAASARGDGRRDADPDLPDAGEKPDAWRRSAVSTNVSLPPRGVGRRLLGREKRTVDRLNTGTVGKCSKTAESLPSGEHAGVKRVESATVVRRHAEPRELTRDCHQLIGAERHCDACGKLTPELSGKAIR